MPHPFIFPVPNLKDLNQDTYGISELYSKNDFVTCFFTISFFIYAYQLLTAIANIGHILQHLNKFINNLTNPNGIFIINHMINTTASAIK